MPAATHAAPAREVARPVRPRLRFRLRTVLIFASLSVLVMPLLGVYVLRLHEDTLLRQTQTELFSTMCPAGSSRPPATLAAPPE